VDEQYQARALELGRKRRARRRAASLCFLAAGVGFGTALYVLRARFHQIGGGKRPLAFAALIALMAALFWFGSRLESEVGEIDEELRQLLEQASRRRRSP
jgi:hypothetical protein